MNRTYSGVFGIKSKSEISFNNIFLPNDTSVQNLQFGLGKALIPGLKLGLYALYYNQNGFNIIDERASFVGPADAADIVIGLPLVFDPSSLPFRGKNASTNETGPTPAEAFFKQISLGVNANYYYSSFDTAHFSSFSFDANLSTRFKVGYIGQPRPVLTAEDLEKEKAGRLRLLGTNKAGADEITALYEGRVADLNEVATARRDIYKIYNDRYTELRSADVSNYFSTAEGELFQLYQEALKGLTQNENLMQARLTKDISDLSVSIADYKEKLSVSSNALYQLPLGEMMTLYKTYVGETYESASFESLRGKYLASAKNHSTKNKEDLKNIARSYFQDEGLAQSLALFNQLDKNAVLKTGQKILVPEKAYFDELASQERRILAQRDESRGYSEHTALSNETWASVALAFLGDKKLEDNLLSFNQKNKTDKLIVGQVIRIPLRTKTREAAETAFWNKLDAKRDDFIKTKPTEMERIFFEGLYEKMRGKVSVFQFKNALAIEKDATATSLGNLLNERKAQFARSRDGLIKDLDRIKLKKQLDNLNASGEKAKATAQQDYKKKERAIFESLLLAIYDSKTLFIEKFRKAAQKNLEDKIVSQKRMAGAQTDALAKYEKVALLEAGKDQVRVKGLQDAFGKQKADLESSADAEVDKTREEFRRIGNELDWRSYMTEMIYRGSTEKRDTLAFGVAVKNIGTELNYGRKSETQPFVFSADMNYELLHLEHHGLILYGHYGYSIFEDHHTGFGLMYRLLNRFEIRSGLVMENLTSKAVLVASGGLAMNLELGLMNYRIDFSAQLREIVGPSFTVGLNVIF